MRTYKGKDGKRYTIPEPQNDVAELFAHLREQLSPEAVAAIAASLQTCCAEDPEVCREVAWFQNGLVDLLGGAEQFNRMMEEIGL